MEYKLKCPQCGYHYWIKTLEPKEYELCPICGCLRRIEDFIMEYKSTRIGLSVKFVARLLILGISGDGNKCPTGIIKATQ